MADELPPAKPVNWLRLACALHLITVWCATLAILFEVETILGSLPAMIVTGLVVLIMATRRNSWLLLIYGLIGLWAAAVVSLAIAAFELRPGNATPTVFCILGAFAVTLTWTGLRITPSLRTVPDSFLTSRKAPRFSVRALLLFTTAMCVLSALASVIPWQKNDMWIFGAGGFCVLGVSAALGYCFHLRHSGHQEIE